MVQGAAGQRNRGGVGQHGEAPGRGFESWSTAVLPGASHPSITGPTATALSCKISLEKAQWKHQRRYGGTGEAATVDWRVLSLRSVGGDHERTDPGGPGLQEFAGTSWLAGAPYLAHVLDSIPAQLRSARLMALGPGVDSGEHSDYKYGPLWGTARLHVPITTTPGAKLHLEGTPHQWQPGTLWFGDFSRTHRVQNEDDVPRVHLVIDTLVSRQLLDLFPAEQREQFLDAALVNRWPVGLSATELSAYRLRCAMPASFLDWTRRTATSSVPRTRVGT
ncbi:aspartyl/asparaginyl beta-hydroxylase domain-containing protein [Micromonospora sp. b486]|uniref:aspartyl/asparaginyl beta-hydroxylase domain-containing protein n=1 Tax=Micromonospora sp. b486 TaxID=3053986 RepID=UPI00259CD3B0|nr:aspartyl/asparaginyl beta-hydroxylase domain-containing protein [Micromonospora sp. b486]MDM4777835.1 aspartyl/asparaginyl beta-hydroxylase domain-containing protein [Micromonospora sp. b486]